MCSLSDFRKSQLLIYVVIDPDGCSEVTSVGDTYIDSVVRTYSRIMRYFGVEENNCAVWKVIHLLQIFLCLNWRHCSVENVFLLVICKCYWKNHYSRLFMGKFQMASHKESFNQHALQYECCTIFDFNSRSFL